MALQLINTLTSAPQGTVPLALSRQTGGIYCCVRAVYVFARIGKFAALTLALVAAARFEAMLSEAS
jgi:hypothetical protein